LLITLIKTKKAVKGWAGACRKHFWNSPLEETSEKNQKWSTAIAVWLPQHENTINMELPEANLYAPRPYGGSVSGFPKVFGRPLPTL